MIDKPFTYSMSCDHCGLIYESSDGTTLFHSRSELRELASDDGWVLTENEEVWMHLCPECYREYCFTPTGKLPE